MALIHVLDLPGTFDSQAYKGWLYLGPIAGCVLSAAALIRTMAAPDITSAEWIAEAPSTLTPGGTAVMPLADFGTAGFKRAAATSTTGHPGTISYSAWTATKIQLESESSNRGPGGPYGPYTADATAGATATPTSLTAAGSAFAVSWNAVPGL